jgi:hypothetical protein
MSRRPLGQKISERLVHPRAVLEETDVRILDLKKDAYEFKRDIVVGTEDARGRMWPRNSLVSWTRNRNQDSDIEASIKNASIKVKVYQDGAAGNKEEQARLTH